MIYKYIALEEKKLSSIHGSYALFNFKDNSIIGYSRYFPNPYIKYWKR